jgi:hypothetical protein
MRTAQSESWRRTFSHGLWRMPRKAIACARTQGPESPLSVVDELLGWVGSGRERDGRVPFLDGDLAGYAGLALGNVGALHEKRLFNALLGRIPSVAGLEALPNVGKASTWRIGKSTHAFANFNLLIHGYGLPRDFARLQAYAQSVSED